MASVVPELLVSVRLWNGLVAPTMVLPKVMLAMESVATIAGSEDEVAVELPPAQLTSAIANTAQDTKSNKQRIPAFCISSKFGLRICATVEATIMTPLCCIHKHASASRRTRA
jgi:hypothetical protein